MSKSWAGGSSRAWRAVRASVLERDDHLCRIRLPGSWRTRTRDNVRCARVADTAHHLHGRGSQCHGCRTDHPDHLVAACTNCNTKVGDPSARRPARATTTRAQPIGRTKW